MKLKVNLYSGYSTLAVARISNQPVIRYYPLDSNMQQLMQDVFPEMQLEYARNYPLTFAELDNGVKICYSIHVGPTPFTPQLVKAKAPDKNAIVLQPTGMMEYFGLKGLGLFPIIETELLDIPLAYEKSDSILNFWTENEFNAYYDPNSENFDQGKNCPVHDIDSETITPLDNYYYIAAREMVNEGYRPKVINRQTEDLDVITMPANTAFDISMGYEVYSCDYIPMLDENIERKALEYYEEGVPEKYQWLQSVQPLDFLSLWALELDKKYTMQLYCPLGKGTGFGDEMEFTVKHDPKYNSRYVSTLAPTGEEMRLEDHVIPEWVHSYAAVTGEGAAELANKGFPYRDMLNLKRSLQL